MHSLLPAAWTVRLFARTVYFKLELSLTLGTGSSKFARPLSMYFKESFEHVFWKILTLVNRTRWITKKYFSKCHLKVFYYVLENANEKPVHQKCIKLLMIKIYKYLAGLSPDIMIDIFKLRENTYNLRNFYIFESQNHRAKKV